jgi:hypothetical protein
MFPNPAEMELVVQFFACIFLELDTSPTEPNVLEMLLLVPGTSGTIESATAGSWYIKN